MEVKAWLTEKEAESLACTDPRVRKHSNERRPWTGGETHKYDDIIDLPHPVSTSHPRMRLADRAAQFSPYAALTGYGDEISEVSRLTDARVELTDEEQSELNQTLLTLSKQCNDARVRRHANRETPLPKISVTYFRPDAKKDGGAYVQHAGLLKQVDAVSGMLRFAEGIRIPIEDIIEIIIKRQTLNEPT